jgi:hypothetical protein
MSKPGFIQRLLAFVSLCSTSKSESKTQEYVPQPPVAVPFWNGTLDDGKRNGLPLTALAYGQTIRVFNLPEKFTITYTYTGCFAANTPAMFDATFLGYTIRHITQEDDPMGYTYPSISKYFQTFAKFKVVLPNGYETIEIILRPQFHMDIDAFLEAHPDIVLEYWERLNTPFVDTWTQVRPPFNHVDTKPAREIPLENALVSDC